MARPIGPASLRTFANNLRTIIQRATSDYSPAELGINAGWDAVVVERHGETGLKLTFPNGITYLILTADC